MEYKVRNGKILTFRSFSITQRKKLTFDVNGLSDYARMMHRQKAYGMLIPKIKFSGRGIFELLLQQPWYSIEQKVRNSIILTFTSSFTQLEKPAFYLHGLTSYVRMRQRQKDYWPYILKIQFFDRRKFKFLLQEPWNSIEHKVRNSIILTFTSSITQLEKPAFYLHRLSSYAKSTSTESLLTVDSKNTIFRPA